jgi:hypothetical protein
MKPQPNRPILLRPHADEMWTSGPPVLTVATAAPARILLLRTVTTTWARQSPMDARAPGGTYGFEPATFGL